MARIDCSVTANYLREKNRMCDLYKGDCTNCPMNIRNNCLKVACYRVMSRHPETAVEIVQKWSDEHPQKTRLDDLLEKYPNVPLTDGLPRWIAPFHFGYCGECKECRMIHSGASCWNEPVDGGATGKAVE